jgi:cytochrome oxidase Cu insertion factor (SCO1/SenC/PrrC family)
MCYKFRIVTVVKNTIMKEILILVLLFAMGSLSAQLINDDEFTSKGAIVLEEGMTVPNFKFKNLKAQTFNLHDKIDKLTILEFWYTTCKTCVANKKYVTKFSNQYSINIISIAVDEKASTVRKYLSDNNIHWENIQDSNSFKGFYQKTKGVASPTFVVVNADKEIIKVFKDGSSIGKIGVFLQNYVE